MGKRQEEKAIAAEEAGSTERYRGCHPSRISSQSCLPPSPSPQCESQKEGRGKIGVNAASYNKAYAFFCLKYWLTLEFESFYWAEQFVNSILGRKFLFYTPMCTSFIAKEYLQQGANVSQERKCDL